MKKKNTASKQYLLLVSNNEKGFIVNSVKEAILHAGIEVISATVDEADIANYLDVSFGVLFVDVVENSFSLNLIKSKCYEMNKKVILYGSPEEIESLKRVFIESMIFAKIERPAEISDIISAVQKLQKKTENQSEMYNVLVVDDNAVFLRTIMGWLEDKYSVTLANSASNAMTAIQKNIPDLILLDYEMPICSGAQFMEMLASTEVTRDIPIIFLTSRGDEKTVKEVMQLRPKGYLLKTTPKEAVLERIEALFDSIE